MLTHAGGRPPYLVKAVDTGGGTSENHCIASWHEFGCHTESAAKGTFGFGCLSNDWSNQLTGYGKGQTKTSLCLGSSAIGGRRKLTVSPERGHLDRIPYA